MTVLKPKLANSLAQSDVNATVRALLESDGIMVRMPKVTGGPRQASKQILVCAIV